jgi:hypothetical protein
MLQPNDTPLQISFNEKRSHVEVDAFGNIYVINNDEIIKYNVDGVLQKKIQHQTLW